MPATLDGKYVILNPSGGNYNAQNHPAARNVVETLNGSCNIACAENRWKEIKQAGDRPLQATYFA